MQCVTNQLNNYNNLMINLCHKNIGSNTKMNFI